VCGSVLCMYVSGEVCVCVCVYACVSVYARVSVWCECKCVYISYALVSVYC
jgi:hypothetical protein